MSFPMFGDMLNTPSLRRSKQHLGERRKRCWNCPSFAWLVPTKGWTERFLMCEPEDQGEEEVERGDKNGFGAGLASDSGSVAGGERSAIWWKITSGCAWQGPGGSCCGWSGNLPLNWTAHSLPISWIYPWMISDETWAGMGLKIFGWQLRRAKRSGAFLQGGRGNL
jgi:hypothetical protein